MDCRVQKNKTNDLGDFLLGFLKNINNPEPYIKESIDNFIKKSDFEFLKDIYEKIDKLNTKVSSIDNKDDSEFKNIKEINDKQDLKLESIKEVDAKLDLELQSLKEVNDKQDLKLKSLDDIINTNIVESYFVTDPKNIKKTIGVNDSSIRIGVNNIKDWDGNDNSQYKNLKGNISLGHNCNGSLVPNEKISTISHTRNISIGNGTLAFNEIGNYNTMVGHNACIYSETGSANTGVGYTALMDTKSGGYNTAIGSGSGTYNNGSYNTFLGRWSGRPTDSKVLNWNWTTCVGSGTQATNSNQVVLGTEKEHVYSALPIQISSSDSKFQNNTSECKLGLEFIKKLVPIEFELVNNSSEKEPRKHIGLTAQEVKKVMDEMKIDYAFYQDHFKTGGFKRETISYESLIPAIIKAIKELEQKNDDLEKEIESLKSIMNSSNIPQQTEELQQNPGY